MDRRDRDLIVGALRIVREAMFRDAATFPEEHEELKKKIDELAREEDGP